MNECMDGEEREKMRRGEEKRGREDDGRLEVVGGQMQMDDTRSRPVMQGHSEEWLLLTLPYCLSQNPRQVQKFSCKSRCRVLIICVFTAPMIIV